MPDRLGDGPAVVIVQFHQQAADHLAAALPGLPPGKAPGYLSQQVRQQRGPGLIGYRGSSDCRVLVVSHKPIMIAAAAPLRGPLTCALPWCRANTCMPRAATILPLRLCARETAGGRLRWELSGWSFAPSCATT